MLINLHGISGQVILLTVLIIAAPTQTADHKAIINLPYLEGLPLAHLISSAKLFSITCFAIGADRYWNIVKDHVVRGNIVVEIVVIQSRLSTLSSFGDNHPRKHSC